MPLFFRAKIPKIRNSRHMMIGQVESAELKKQVSRVLNFDKAAGRTGCGNVIDLPHCIEDEQAHRTSLLVACGQKCYCIELEPRKR